MPLNVLLLVINLMGVAIAAAVISPLLDIAAMVRSPIIRRRWRILASMLVCVIAMMLAVALTIRQTPDVTAFATAGSYTLGATFLMGVVRLARSSTRDALRLDELEKAAFVDPLTGLGNRRRFDERLSDEVRHARATSLPLSLLVLDVDHFKRVNDAYGHGIGDLVLRQVAVVIAAGSHHGDTACRIGGEEFAVIVPGLEGAFAAATAERLRRAVGETATSREGVADVRVTASLGFATLRPGETGDMLFRRADAALYDAKHSGRDRMAEAA